MRTLKTLKPGTKDLLVRYRRGCFKAKDGALHRLAGRGPAAAARRDPGQVRRRQVGPGQAGLDAAARRGGALGGKPVARSGNRGGG